MKAIRVVTPGLAFLGGSAALGGRWAVLVSGGVLLASLILVTAVVFARDDRPVGRLVALLSVTGAPLTQYEEAGMRPAESCSQPMLDADRLGREENTRASTH